MKIIPLRGLNIRGVGHAPSGIPVEVDEKQAKELIILGVARKAPPLPVVEPAAAVEAPASPVVETAVAPAAPEAAVAPAAPAAAKPARRRG